MAGIPPSLTQLGLTSNETSPVVLRTLPMYCFERRRFSGASWDLSSRKMFGAKHMRFFRNAFGDSFAAVANSLKVLFMVCFNTVFILWLLNFNIFWKVFLPSILSGDMIFLRLPLKRSLDSLLTFDFILANQKSI